MARLDAIPVVLSRRSGLYCAQSRSRTRKRMRTLRGTLPWRRRALKQLMSATSLGQRQALGHDRVDLATTKQLEQREEVLPEPIRVARHSAHCSGSVLGRVAQLLDPVGEHPPAWREQAP